MRSERRRNRFFFGMLAMFIGITLAGIGVMVIWVGRSLPPDPVGVGLFLISGAIGWLLVGWRTLP